MRVLSVTLSVLLFLSVLMFAGCGSSSEAQFQYEVVNQSVSANEISLIVYTTEESDTGLIVINRGLLAENQDSYGIIYIDYFNDSEAAKSYRDHADVVDRVFSGEYGSDAMAGQAAQKHYVAGFTYDGSQKEGDKGALGLYQDDKWVEILTW